MASQDWHSSEKFQRAVQSFHDRHARQPTEQICEARRLHTTYMGEIDRLLREKKICTRMEYAGSTYEGTKVAKSPGNSDLEFDVMDIIDCRGNAIEVEPLPKTPGFTQLKMNSVDPANKPFGELDGNYLEPKKTASKFHGVIQSIVNESDILKNNVRLRDHGPAVQMDVYRDNNLFYSVDTVPTYEINGERYVSKPIKDESKPNALAWRRSFSVEEKEKLLGADGCQKKVLRILKAVRHREVGLFPLTSYHLKTALFYEMDGNRDWKEENLGERFIGVINQLEKRLENGNFPHYFLGDGVNLIGSYQDIAVANSRDRLKRLQNSESEMMKVLA